MIYAKSHDRLLKVVYEGRVIEEQIGLFCNQSSATKTSKREKKKKRKGTGKRKGKGTNN